MYSFAVFWFSVLFEYSTNGLIINNVNTNKHILIENDKNRYNPFSRKYFQDIRRRNNTENHFNTIVKKYPITRPTYIEELRRLNSKNVTIQTNSILGVENQFYDENDDNNNITDSNANDRPPRIRIILNKSNILQALGIELDENGNISNDVFGNFEEFGNENPNIDSDNNNNNNGDNNSGSFDEDEQTGRSRYVERPNTKSKNFEAITKFNILFKDVGGYENVKQELRQCVDILKNYQKYAKYNVRIPKGLILEGPPGTGKTLLAKALAGESNCSFIPVSGSDFQEKYVGVGSSRIKELFELAKKNVPCIIFIDEIDAVGRKRSTDGESSSNERDSTLNSLLVELDGFKNNTGIFLVAATNRIDLLDNALTRPGRIDKKISIGLPDKNTRESIIKIHIKGKPYCNSIGIEELVEVTEGFSGAQIENLLNEAMLNALRMNTTEFCYKDFDFVLNKMMAGWQPNDHEFTTDIIDHIAIHEMGHAVVGLLSKHHSKVSKVVINLSSPKSPGYTVFEGSTSNIYIREALFEHLMILLAGRIAEEVFYDVSVTTGAINDFEEALKLAEKMIIYYGMGSNIIYPSLSEKYKEMIDTEVVNLLNDAYKCANVIIQNAKEFIRETSEILKRDKIIKVDKLNELLTTKYKHLENSKIEFE
jgi:cell division protease FtsH